MIEAVQAGLGRHGVALKVEQDGAAMAWISIAWLFSIVSFALPKVAATVLITRLLRPSRGHSVFLWFMVAFCKVLLLSSVVGLATKCLPSQGMVVPNARHIYDVACFQPRTAALLSVSSSAISVVTNLYLAVYMAWSMPKLKLVANQKAALTISIGLGVVALTAAIFKYPRLVSLGSPDFTDVFIMTALEGTSIIIAVCIPALQPLLGPLLARLQPIFGLTRRHLQPSQAFGLYRASSSAGSRHRNDPELCLGACEPIEIQLQVEIFFCPALRPADRHWQSGLVGAGHTQLSITKEREANGVVTTTVSVVSSALS